MTNQQTITYGLVVAAAVFFVGWMTGMGGSFGPNLVFSILMGLMATIVMRLVTKYMQKNRDE